MEKLVTSKRKGGGWKSGKGFDMRNNNVIEITQFRESREKKRHVAPLNAGKNGRVYSRGGKLWVDFHYLKQRVREPSGLKDTPANRRQLRQSWI